MQRQKMPLEKRAKIFLPFDALEGFRDELKLKNKKLKYEQKKELSIDEVNIINDNLNKIKKGNMLEVTYYNNKVKRYDTIKGIFSKIQRYYFLFC